MEKSILTVLIMIGVVTSLCLLIFIAMWCISLIDTLCDKHPITKKISDVFSVLLFYLVIGAAALVMIVAGFQSIRSLL